jgi:prolyl-tRNA synthetase
MGARVLDKDGKEVTIIMGSYGIGVERILTSCIEQNHDDNGFWLAPEIAPSSRTMMTTASGWLRRLHRSPWWWWRPM